MQKVFSHSSLSCFENCPRQYYFRYIEKRPVESESIEAFLGKRVHEVLERLHLFVADGRIPSLPRVLERFQRNWDEAYDAERVRIVRGDTSPESYREAGARGLERYYRRNYPFESGETVALERNIQFSLDESGDYKLRGIIDKIVRAPDGVLEIHDYKTSQRVPARRFLERNRQLPLYELGVREQMGETGAIRLVLDYVLLGQLRVSTRSHDELQTLREETKALIDRIRMEDEWETRTGPLCDWCEFRDACPVFGGEAPRPRAPARPPDPEPPPALDEDGQWRLL